MVTANADEDLATEALLFWALWGGPIAIMLSSSFLGFPLAWTTNILTVCLAWMCTGCAVNARKCHSRHCYYASPVLLLGAVLTLIIGFGVADFGPYGLMYVSPGIFALVLLTFLPENCSANTGIDRGLLRQDEAY